MDDGRARRERGELAGDAVVEARADRDQHVALVHRPVRPLGAVHARPAEVELVRLRERALRHQRRDDRELPQLRERAKLVAGLGVDRPAADVEHGPLRVGDRLRRRSHLLRVHARGRAPAGQVDLVRIAEVELRLLDVARNVDEHRAAAPRAGDVERGLDRVRQLLHVLDEPRVLDDRDRDAGDVALLEGVGADQVRAHLPRDADERRRVHPGVGDRRHQVRRARPGGGERDADAARRARVALRHVAGALLVAGEHVPDRRAARERVVGRQDRAAGDAEHGLDALRLERAQQSVGAVHPHQTASVRNSALECDCGSRASTASVSSLLIETVPTARRRAGSAARTRPPRRALPRRPLAEALAEHQRGREQHRARIRDALAGDVGRGSVARPEDARAVLGEPAPGEHAPRRRGTRRARRAGRAAAERRRRRRTLRLDDERADRAARRRGA